MREECYITRERYNIANSLRLRIAVLAYIRVCTHRNAFVFAPSGYSTSIIAETIPPAASRADAKNNTLTDMVDDMARSPY